MDGRWDWYQATVRAPVADIRACLLELGQGGAWEALQRVPNGYQHGDKLSDADGVVAEVWWGDRHQWPHVKITGETAQPASELLRVGLPDHAVTRADACIDYAEAGAYDRLQALALGVAKDCGVKVGTAGDHLLTFKGRTCYLGAPSSHTRLRLYDKAEQLRGNFANDPVRLAGVPAELARLECQVRPQTREAKEEAARLSPIELMGSAAWMRQLMRLVADIELEPFQAGKVWRQSDDTRAYAAVLAQYGGLFKRLAQDQGWECLGLQLRDDLAERDAYEKLMRGGPR